MVFKMVESKRGRLYLKDFDVGIKSYEAIYVLKLEMQYLLNNARAELGKIEFS